MDGQENDSLIRQLDEVFERLKKSPLERMMDLWNVESFQVDVLSPDYVHERAAFFESHGWTWERFFEERKNYLLRCDGR